MKFKRWFKKTKLGRGLRHVRNFFWRSHIENYRWQRNDPEGWRNYQLMKPLSFSD